MLNLDTILKILERGDSRLDFALDRHDGLNHRQTYVPPGAFVEPLTPYDEAHSIVLDLHYSDGKDGDVRIVQR